MRIICGVDGCKGGWVCIAEDIDTGRVSWRQYENATGVLYQQPTPLVIAIDIPIGLPEKGSRNCDLEARQLLGRPRACSIFPAPIRPVLAATSYAEACQIGYAIEKRKLSQQSWAILPKIKDIDTALRRDPALRHWVREVHPEVCFYELAGKHPMKLSKKTKVGQTERLSLLRPHFGQPLESALGQHRQVMSAPDDVLDAFAALWTAERILAGQAKTLPAAPPQDAYGLRMEMVA